jgi:hypothetical protein
MNPVSDLAKISAAALIDQVIKNEGLRNFALDYAIKAAYRASMQDGYPTRIKEVEFIGKRNLILVVDKALQNKDLAPEVRKRLLKNLIGRIFLPNQKLKQEFYKRHGVHAPGFLTISPTAHCNLFCEGCYAGSSSRERAHLDYEVFSRILEEKERFWGATSRSSREASRSCGAAWAGTSSTSSGGSRTSTSSCTPTAP